MRKKRFKGFEIVGRYYNEAIGEILIIYTKRRILRSNKILRLIPFLKWKTSYSQTVLVKITKQLKKLNLKADTMVSRFNKIFLKNSEMYNKHTKEYAIVKSGNLEKPMSLQLTKVKDPSLLSFLESCKDLKVLIN